MLGLFLNMDENTNYKNFILLLKISPSKIFEDESVHIKKIQQVKLKKLFINIRKINEKLLFDYIINGLQIIQIDGSEIIL